jgi:drug/metabolite transporter (DMT)-like permease
VAALAGPLLHEWVGWHRLVAIAVGFAGVPIVMHPGFGTLHWAMLFSLAATLSYALYNLSTRYLATFDPPEVTQTYSPLVGAAHSRRSRSPPGSGRKIWAYGCCSPRSAFGAALDIGS